MANNQPIGLLSDPVDIEKKMAILRPLSGKKILDLLDEWYPDWVANTTAEISIDLIELAKKWHANCFMNGKLEKIVLLVNDLGLTSKMTPRPHSKLVRFLCDTLTEQGYLVLDNTHFTTCKGCYKLIVSEYVLSRPNAQRMGLIFTGNCNECQPQDAFVKSQNK
jgi:hypothetical protein